MRKFFLALVPKTTGERTLVICFIAFNVLAFLLGFFHLLGVGFAVELEEAYGGTRLSLSANLQAISLGAGFLCLLLKKRAPGLWALLAPLVARFTLTVVWPLIQ